MSTNDYISVVKEGSMKPDLVARTARYRTYGAVRLRILCESDDAWHRTVRCRIMPDPA